MSFPTGWGRSGFAVVVPARNEERRLPRLLRSLDRDPVPKDVLILANGCTDATAERAWGHRGRWPVAVLETPAHPGGVGRARRIGFAAALARLPRGSLLATTDADCVVADGWGRATLAALRAADLACGRILPDPVEFAGLPALVRCHGTFEDRLDDLRAIQAAVPRWRQHMPLLLHGQSPGASLAFRADAYRLAGGFDPLPCHEDRLIADRMDRMGFRVVRPRAIQVYASCRQVGRAPGGMAATIAFRADAAELLRAEIAEMHAETRHRLRFA